MTPFEKSRSTATRSDAEGQTADRGDHTVPAGRPADELRILTSRLHAIGGLAEKQLGAALDALRTRDDSLAREVIGEDRQIDSAAAAIEELVIGHLERPDDRAGEVRRLVAALRIAAALERIGDLGKNIAKRAIVLNGSEPMRIVNPVVRMGRQTQTLLAEVLDAYANGDTARALTAWHRDIELDQVNSSLFDDLVTCMTNDPRTIGTCSQLQFVVKNLERIGDHATFIAEMTYFVAEGRPLGDKRPKFDPLARLPDSESGPAEERS